MERPFNVVETHGRAETKALLEGLEVIPRRRIDYKGTAMNPAAQLAHDAMTAATRGNIAVYPIHPAGASPDQTPARASTKPSAASASPPARSACLWPAGWRTRSRRSGRSPSRWRDAGAAGAGHGTFPQILP